MENYNKGEVVETSHLPVFEREVVTWLTGVQTKKARKRFVDVTLGGGGHAKALLAALPQSQLLGIDRDEQALERSRQRLESFKERIFFRHGDFSLLQKHLEAIGWDAVDGVIADLGVSSFQLDEAERGFSFRRKGPLDMRMDRSKKMTAEMWLELISESEMADAFLQYGEERHSERIARHLCRRRQEKKFSTTEDLAEEVVKALPASARFPRTKGGKRIHPATRIFQAIRIAINEELEELHQFLTHAPLCLAEGGRCVVISYHSLEDRMVKHTFRAWCRENFSLPVRRAIIPSDEEIQKNPRARSAKLRVLERVLS